METIPLNVLSKAVNSWVIQTPGRQYPAVLVQGDSLHSLFSMAKHLNYLTSSLGSEEAHDIACELEDLLRGKLLVYESALRDHGIELPYTTGVEDSDRMDEPPQR